MKNNIQIFNSPEFGQVRAVEIDNEPYFVGRDVAACLGYVKPENAIRQHVDNEDTLKQGISDNQGVPHNTILINESGVYSLIFGSKLPTAKRFKRWVTKEVLPSIRKTGYYSGFNNNIDAYKRKIALIEKTLELQQLQMGLIRSMIDDDIYMDRNAQDIETNAHTLNKYSHTTYSAPILKNARKAKGLSISELARRVNKNHSHIIKIENGKSVPLTTFFFDLVKAMGYTIILSDNENIGV